MEVEISFKSDFGNHTEKPIDKGFKQDNNQQISRDKESNKRILLSTDEAMEEWQTRFSDGFFGDTLSIHQFHANYIAKGLLIHQILS